MVALRSESTEGSLKIPCLFGKGCSEVMGDDNFRTGAGVKNMWNFLCQLNE